MHAVAPKFKVIDVPFEKGSITPRLAAAHFYKRLPLISKIYPLLADESKWADGKPVISSITPVFARMISGMSMVPLREKIEKDGKRRFLTSNCNDTVGTWRLEIPERYLNEKMLEKDYLLFAVENGVYTIKEGKNAWSSILEDENDMRFLQFRTSATAKTSTWSAMAGHLFKGIDRDYPVTLHGGYKEIKGYESFVNIVTVGASYMMSTTNPHRNVNLNPNMTIANGAIELEG